MEKQETQERVRFDMIKTRHKNTFETALKQGKVDEQMQGLCEFVANTKNYFTSSCCSGRIILLEKQSDKKIDSFFHRKWHRTINKEELLEGFEEKVKGELWFKVDPFILHIGTSNLENANKILKAMKEAGIKRGGIILAEEGKYLLELIGTETLAFPIKNGEEKLIDENYLKNVLEKANLMLQKNYKRLEKLEEAFKSSLN